MFEGPSTVRLSLKISTRKRSSRKIRTFRTIAYNTPSGGIMNIVMTQEVIP